MGRLIDTKLFVQLLQAVLHAAQRQAAAVGDGAVGQPQGDVLQHFVFCIGKAQRLVLGLLLDAANLAVDHALLLDEQAAQRQAQAFFGRSLEDVAVGRPLRNDARNAAYIGFIGIVGPEQNRGLGTLLPDRLGRLDASSPGHLQVHHHTRHLMLVGQTLADLAVVGLQQARAFGHGGFYDFFEEGAVHRIVFY